MPGYTLADGITVKNKLGATSHEELEKIEVEYVVPRILEIELGFWAAGQFDGEHLKAIHYHIFQDVFEWAGRTRDERVKLSDGTIATEPILRKPNGKPFLTGTAIPAALNSINAKIREADYLRGLSRAAFAEAGAHIMAELNAIHPFREGNGRTQRIFMEQLAEAAGHELDFTVVSKERMIQASIAANEQGDTSMMHRLFDEISNPARVSLMRDSIIALDAVKYDWNNRYIATLQPGYTVEVVLAGISGEQFMARTNNQILFGRTCDLPEPFPETGQTFKVSAKRDKE